MTELNNSLEAYFENSCITWDYKEDGKFEHYHVAYLHSRDIEEILKIFKQYSATFLLTAEKESLKIFYEKQQP